MKNIIIILERSELNYLIKYDSLRASSDRIINFSYNEFKQLSENMKVSLLQNSLPIYEQDHEVLLIEYNTRLIGYDNSPTLEFNGISSIIPLTEIGARLLSSKLNINFKISGPLDSEVYKSFFYNRDNILRNKAGQQLCSIYKVPIPDEEFISDFKRATLFQINNINPEGNDSTLAHLIDFNVTPSFIPEGNIEALIKSACVGMKKLSKEIEQITRSMFYSFVIEEKETINRKSLFQAIQYVQDKIELNEDAKIRFNQLKSTLSEDGKYGNAFLLFSYYYSLKKEIEKNDYDISAPKNNILELKHYDIEAASKALFMLGYTFSIQTISKSMQSFSKSTLLKTQKKLNLEWYPKVIKPKVIEESKLEKTNIDIDNKHKQNSNKSDKEGAVIVKPSIDRKQGNDESVNRSKIKDVLKDEKSIEIELSVENQLEESTTIIESKTNNELESINFEKKSDSKQPGFFDEEEIISAFSFTDFKNNIGGGNKSKALIDTINSKIDIKKEVSKELIIACLKENGQYKTKSGKKDLTSLAKKALKIFE